MTIASQDGALNARVLTDSSVGPDDAAGDVRFFLHDDAAADYRIGFDHGSGLDVSAAVDEAGCLEAYILLDARIGRHDRLMTVRRREHAADETAIEHVVVNLRIFLG